MHLKELSELEALGEKKRVKLHSQLECEPDEFLGHSYHRQWGSYPLLYLIKNKPLAVQEKARGSQGSSPQSRTLISKLCDGIYLILQTCLLKPLYRSYSRSYSCFQVADCTAHNVWVESYSFFRISIIRLFSFPHLKSVEHEGLVVWAQLLVWQASRTSPAHPHLACRHHLQLKVPFPGIHAVSLFSPEDPEALCWYVGNVGSSCWRRRRRAIGYIGGVPSSLPWQAFIIQVKRYPYII